MKIIQWKEAQPQKLRESIKENILSLEYIPITNSLLAITNTLRVVKMTLFEEIVAEKADGVPDVEEEKIKDEENAQENTEKEKDEVEKEEKKMKRKMVLKKLKKKNLRRIMNLTKTKSQKKEKKLV